MDLFLAAQEGDVDVVRSLFQADPKSLYAKNANGLSAYMVAIYWGHPDVASAMLELGYSPNFFESVASGNLLRAQELLDENPALLTAYAPDGFTALQIASYFGHAELAKHLIFMGADVHAVSKNDMKIMPLHAAAANGSSDTCDALLQAGAQVDAQQEGGFTPLHAAAQSGNEPLIRLLQKYSADAGITTYDGKTPLELALDNNHVGAADLLRRRLEI